MSFQLTINKKPVIFKSGVRMNKQLDKLSTMVYIDDEGNKIMGIAGTGKVVIGQFLNLISSPEAEADTILSTLSDLLFAMQKEVKQEEIEDYLDSIEDEAVLADIVQKVYDELPKQSKKLTLKSETTTPPTLLP